MLVEKLTLTLDDRQDPGENKSHFQHLGSTASVLLGNVTNCLVPRFWCQKCEQCSQIPMADLYDDVTYEDWAMGHGVDLQRRAIENVWEFVVLRYNL